MKEEVKPSFFLMGKENLAPEGVVKMGTMSRNFVYQSQQFLAQFQSRGA